MCLWPTVALTVSIRCLHTWPRLLWSPHPGTLCQAQTTQKFFCWKLTYCLEYLEALLTKGLCTLQKQSEPEAFLGGAMWGSLGVCRGQGDMARSSLSLHSNLSHTAWRTPRSQLPHKQLAAVRTGLHLHFNLRTFLQGVDVLLPALQEPKFTQSPPHTWAPRLQSQMDNLRESALGCCMTLLTGYFGNYGSTSHNLYKMRRF